jgi:hypothetical protein
MAAKIGRYRGGGRLRKNQVGKPARRHREEARFVISFHRFAAILCLVCVQPGFALADKAQDALVEQIEWLEQQASLVRSARCEFRLTFLPTRPVSAREAQLMGTVKHVPYRAVWWWKGFKEREDRDDEGRGYLTPRVAFDGEFTRELRRQDDKTFGLIQSGLKGPLSSIRSFAFDYGAITNAQVIRLSGDRQVARGKYLGQDRLEVIVRDPRAGGAHLMFVFDGEHRLVRRDVLSKSPQGGEFTLWERHEFLGHKPYDGGGGRKIWFPSEAILRVYKNQNNEAIESVVRHITIDKIDFNIDIPDEQFAFEFPQDVTVYNSLEKRLIQPRKPIDKKN